MHDNSYEIFRESNQSPICTDRQRYFHITRQRKGRHGTSSNPKIIVARNIDRLWVARRLMFDTFATEKGKRSFSSVHRTKDDKENRKRTFHKSCLRDALLMLIHRE